MLRLRLTSFSVSPFEKKGEEVRTSLFWREKIEGLSMFILMINPLCRAAWLGLVSDSWFE